MLMSELPQVDPCDVIRTGGAASRLLSLQTSLLMLTVMQQHECLACCIAPPAGVLPGGTPCQWVQGQANPSG